MNRLTNPEVRPTSAEIAVHRAIDVGIGRFRDSREERRGGHDLPRLAIAALRHVDLLPCDLQRMRPAGRQSFNRGDRRADRGGDHRLTRPYGPATEMDGAGTALTDAAPELGAAQIEHITERP